MSSKLNFQQRIATFRSALNIWKQRQNHFKNYCFSTSNLCIGYNRKPNKSNTRNLMLPFQYNIETNSLETIQIHKSIPQPWLEKI